MVDFCKICSKKLGVVVLACKCEEPLCNAHRHPEDHACTFDFKAAERERLRRKLVKCVGAKLAPL